MEMMANADFREYDGEWRRMDDFMNGVENGDEAVRFPLRPYGADGEPMLNDNILFLQGFTFDNPQHAFLVFATAPLDYSQTRPHLFRLERPLLSTAEQLLDTVEDYARRLWQEPRAELYPIPLDEFTVIVDGDVYRARNRGAGLQDVNFGGLGFKRR